MILHRSTVQGATRRSFIIGLWSLGGLTVLGTTGFMLIEGWSFTEAIYMTTITLSTVGYGEVYPLSPSGRLFAIIFIIVGITTAIYTLTRVGQVVLEGELFGDMVRRRMQQAIGKLENHYILCGFGRTARPVAEGLEQKGLPFVIIDKEDHIIDELKEHDYLHVIGDATQDEVLTEAAVERASAILALLPSDAENLYITVTAKYMSPNIRVIARAADEKAMRKLSRGGADDVVSPYDLAGTRLLQAAVDPSVKRFMELAADRHFLDLNFAETPVTGESPLNGLSLKQAHIRSKYGVIVVAITREPAGMIFNPDPTELLRESDTLVVVGTSENLTRFHHDTTN